MDLKGGVIVYFKKELSRILIFTTLLLAVTSCAVLHISPPGPFVKSILVLPVKATNTSISPIYGYYYGYEITSAADKSVTYEAIFKLPNHNGMLLIDSIPPGDYFVSKAFVIPVSAGTLAVKSRVASRRDKFKLESGKITILQIALGVSVVDDPNFYGTIISSRNIFPVYQSQKDEILATLGNLENFDKWEVSSWKVLNVDSNWNEQPLHETNIAGTGITGTYRSQRSGAAHYFEKSLINIKQIGNDIVGTNKSQSKIVTGTRKGNTIEFKYIGGVTGVWKINSDSTHLEGTWEATNGVTGKWNLTRIE